MECRHSKSNRQKLHTFGCEYLFMDLKLCKFICIVVLYLHTMFWANLRHGQKIDWKALTIFYDLKRPQKTRNYVFQQGIVVLDFFG